MDKKKVDLENFTLMTVLGKGSYAKVILVRKRDTNEIFAMKVLKKKNIAKRRQEEHTLTERSILIEARHPFVIRLYFSFQNERKLFFVMEYCPGGELFNLLQKRRRFTEDE